MVLVGRLHTSTFPIFMYWRSARLVARIIYDQATPPHIPIPNDIMINTKSLQELFNNQNVSKISNNGKITKIITFCCKATSAFSRDTGGAVNDVIKYASVYAYT